MKLIATLLVLFATAASAQTYNPWIGIPTPQSGVIINNNTGRMSSYTNIPTSPYGGMWINNDTGRMPPYTVTPMPGLRMHMDSRGIITRQYDMGNGMVLDLD